MLSFAHRLCAVLSRLVIISISRPLIDINGLAKTFGTIKAVAGISFSVDKGEVLGFLGPNGAGKSTTMKMITGYLAPSAGSVFVSGYDVVRDPISAQGEMGYLAEGAPAYGEMTPLQFLNFIAAVRGYTGAEKERAVAVAVDRTQLGQVLHQSIDTLSKGFKRRVGIAQAILHDPPVLIMDEPTDGLDPNQKFAVRRLITSMAQDKVIIISTHILEEVDAVCSRAIIIDRGAIVADGTPEELTARSRYHGAVTLEIGADDAQDARSALKSLPGVKDMLDISLEGDMRGGGAVLTVFPESDQRLIEKVSALVTQKGWEVRRLMAESGRLEEVFRACMTADAGNSEGQL